MLWRKIIRPILFTLDAERAHELGVTVLSTGVTQYLANRSEPSETLSIERFGLRFSSPIGIAAGFDKNGCVVNEIANLGFGFVEVGTVTLNPQPGNPKPRLFRLPDDSALINRLGFNNDGAKVVAERLRNLKRRCVVGVNIGKNKDVDNSDAISNYLGAFDLVQSVADYITVNVSSPNTPNLRELQNVDSLRELLASLQHRNQELGRKPLLIKIAPDLSSMEIDSIVDLCVELQIDGIIATNTTVSRENLKTRNVEQFGDGGLSGRPLSDRSNSVIRRIFERSKGELPVIGVGGIFSADDVLAKIRAGASLVQVYTGFAYGGPDFAAKLNSDLEQLLAAEGFDTLDRAVGSLE